MRPSPDAAPVQCCTRGLSRVLFTGGPIVMFDGSLPTSMAIDGDHIAAIGDEAASWAATFDEVIERVRRWLHDTRVFQR